MKHSARFASFCQQMCQKDALTVTRNTPLYTLSTLRIGGAAAMILYPKTIAVLYRTLCLLGEEGLPYLVVGNASNLLFSDDGYDGVIVCTRHLTRFWVRDTLLVAECGVSLPRLARACAAQSLGGLEFAAGIPATVGGAVYQNAGAFGDCIGAHVVSAVVCSPARKAPWRVMGEALSFSYRHSCVSAEDWTVLCVTLALAPRKKEQIEADMQRYAAYRAATQPQGAPSAGSTFVRTEGAPPPAALIEGAGCKGMRIGGAQISQKHAGFVVNAGGAAAADVLALIAECRRKVYEQSGVQLQCEIEYITDKGKEKP